jgi:hypothetical protein
VSGFAVGAGGVTTVTVMVENDCCPKASDATYLIGVADPWNGFVHEAPAGTLLPEQGVNVTTPVDVFTE